MLTVRRREDDGIDLRIGEDLVETVAKRNALPGAERLGLGARPGMPGGEAEAPLCPCTAPTRVCPHRPIPTIAARIMPSTSAMPDHFLNAGARLKAENREPDR